MQMMQISYIKFLTLYYAQMVVCVPSKMYAWWSTDPSSHCENRIPEHGYKESQILMSSHSCRCSRGSVPLAGGWC